MKDEQKPQFRPLPDAETLTGTAHGDDGANGMLAWYEVLLSGPLPAGYPSGYKVDLVRENCTAEEWVNDWLIDRSAEFVFPDDMSWEERLDWAVRFSAYLDHLLGGVGRWYELGENPQWFEVEDIKELEAIIASRLPRDAITTANQFLAKKRVGKIQMYEVALIGAIVRKNCLTNRGEVPFSSIEGFYRYEGSNPPHRYKIRRALDLLGVAGLLVQTDDADHDQHRCGTYRWLLAQRPRTYTIQEED